MTPEFWESAIENFDWGQPQGRDWDPCFRILDGQCCGRAKRWAGHEPGKDHEHLSLLQFIQGRTPDLTAALARLKALEASVVIAHPNEPWLRDEIAAIRKMLGDTG